jgi:hypothetical protein
MTLKIPTSIYGRNAEEDYERVIARTGSSPQPKPLSSRLSSSAFENVSFLSDDDLGREIHNAVRTKYSDIEAITKVNLGKGSNPFYVVAVNEFLRTNYPNLKTVTQADIERVIRENLPLELSGHYEDSGLVLRTRQNPNEYLAGNLFDQFKSQGKNLKENSAYVLWLHNLSLKKDTNSPHGVSFVLLNGFADYFEAPILNETSQQKFESSDIDLATGIPTRVSATGSRTSYTNNLKNGLVRLYLNRNLDLNSYYENLANSYDYGRVALAKSR